MPFIDPETILKTEIIPGYRVRFIHSAHMTFAFWEIEQGAVLQEHSHPHEQVMTVLSGTYELAIDGIARMMKEGAIAIIPSNAKHAGKAITNCETIDVFYPKRNDYG